MMIEYSAPSWGERERRPSCGLDGLPVKIYRRAYVHRYCACAALRAKVAAVELSQQYEYFTYLRGRGHIKHCIQLAVYIYSQAIQL